MQLPLRRLVSDTYQVTPNVTLIAGLRNELTTVRGDKNANNNVNFDLITGTPEFGTRIVGRKVLLDPSPIKL